VARKSIIVMFLIALAVVCGQFQAVPGSVHQLDGVGMSLGFFDGGH
jgi:hypothetical protein